MSIGDSDYAQIGYSIDGGVNWKWITTQGPFNNGLYYGYSNESNALTPANSVVTFPKECENIATFAIAFRFKSSGDGYDQNLDLSNIFDPLSSDAGPYLYN